MKHIATTYLFPLTLILLVIFGVNHCTRDNYQINHPNWDEGHFMCEWHESTSEWIPVLVSKKKGHIQVRNADHGSYIVNDGHLGDPELQELADAVPELCGWKANARPWWRRFGGVANHNHFRNESSLFAFAIQVGPNPDPSVYGHWGPEGKVGFITKHDAVLAHLNKCDGDFNLITIGDDEAPLFRPEPMPTPMPMVVANPTTFPIELSTEVLDSHEFIGLVYEIREGDCLWNIAKTELGDPMLWSTIYEDNPHIGDSPNVIHAGYELVLN